MALADLKLPKITFKRAAQYTEGRTEPVRAFVNHRMVGTLAGTDSYFAHPDRPVSTHFGIGYGTDGVVHISQYVPLDDTAYGAGNYDPSGNWDNWGFKTSEINAQLINIEHQDISHDLPKGQVAPKIQEASMKLQALLRFGTAAQWKAAGLIVRDWTNNAPILVKEIHAIPIDGHHVITHHDIAGNLKPYCWLPWSYDKTGFPRDAYVAGIKKWGDILVNGIPAPAPTPTPTPATYTQTQVDAMIAAAVQSATAAAAAEIQKLGDTNAALQVKINSYVSRAKQIATTLEVAATQLKTQ